MDDFVTLKEVIEYHVKDTAVPLKAGFEFWLMSLIGVEFQTNPTFLIYEMEIRLYSIEISVGRITQPVVYRGSSIVLDATLHSRWQVDIW
jgi:hypothetical protein